MFVKFVTAAAFVLICLFPVIGQEDGGTEAERLVAKAKALVKERKAASLREAVTVYEQAIPLLKEQGLRKEEADALNGIGYIYRRLSEFEKAIPYLEKSSTINKEIGNTNGEITALLNMGQALRYLGRIEEAVSRINQGLALSRESGNKEKEAAALNGLGIIRFNTGEIRKALDHLGAAAAIFEETGKELPQATLLNNIGIINRLYGYRDNAIESYQKALKIFRAKKHKAGEADILLNLAAIYSDEFRISQALDQFEVALSIFRESGDRQRQAVVLNNIGVLYNRLGDYPKSLDYYGQSAELAEKIGNKRQLSTALQNLGIVHGNLGDSDKAIVRLESALGISRELKDAQKEGRVLSSIGVIHGKNGNRELAKSFFEQALEIHRRIGDRIAEAGTLFELGQLLHAMNQSDMALRNFNSALFISRGLRSPGEDAKILLGIARVERDSGNINAARTAIEEAIEKIESLRTGLPGLDLRSAFFSQGRDVYDFYIDLLSDADGRTSVEKNIRKAFEISERSRARSLLESLLESRADIRGGVDPELLKRMRSLQHQLNARERHRLNLIRRNTPAEKLEPVERDIRALLTQYQQVRTLIRTKSPGYAALVQPEPLGLTEIQQSILDSDTVLLEYSLGEKNSHLWIVTTDSIESVRLPNRLEVEKAVRRFIVALNARNIITEGESLSQRSNRIRAADREFVEANKSLSKVVLPFDPKRFSGKRLAIVPDGALQYVPFAALTTGPSKTRETGPQFLIETNEIVTLPSASTLAVLRGAEVNRDSSGKNSVAVLADPVFSADDVRVKARLAKKSVESKKEDTQSLRIEDDTLPPQLRSGFSRLRFSRREANEISSLLPDNEKFVALDFAASVDSINSEKFRQARIIHLATHGIIRSELPELSGIVLSLVDENGAVRDGFLRLHDIYNMRLGADLVVLSACDTALGKEIRGEGIVGLTRGFMYAGASGVVASLWKVDDRATAELMKRFYRNLLTEGLRPADALRRAQISMIRETTTRNPYFWAAFTIQGDWK